jgi:hypothetical protein
VKQAFSQLATGSDPPMGVFGKVGRELVDRGSPLFGPVSQVDRWDRTRLGHARVAAERLFEPWEPRWPLEPVDRVGGQAALVAVYRRANAAAIERLVADGPAQIGLWALDEPAPSLEEWTIGTGPGHRFALLNKVLDALPIDPAGWTVVADDDVRFLRGDLRRSIDLARRARLDLAQPSHARWSYLNWEVTRHRPGRRVRLCRYVEQGPFIILSPAARQAITPFPEDLGMGWGVEADWGAAEQLRVGIIDAVTVVHERPVGQGGYDGQQQREQSERLLEQHGWQDWQTLQATRGTWWGWQAHPPWCRPTALGGRSQ